MKHKEKSPRKPRQDGLSSMHAKPVLRGLEIQAATSLGTLSGTLYGLDFGLQPLRLEGLLVDDLGRGFRFTGELSGVRFQRERTGGRAGRSTGRDVAMALFFHGVLGEAVSEAEARLRVWDWWAQRGWPGASEQRDVNRGISRGIDAMGGLLRILVRGPDGRLRFACAVQPSFSEKGGQAVLVDGFGWGWVPERNQALWSHWLFDSLYLAGGS